MREFELRAGPDDGWIYYWFVQYNPFYFFSASWVLLGMYMVTSDLSDWYAGQLVVAVVMHLYELCLLGGAWLLFRMAGKRRPATILGLAALFFLFDPTLRSEGVTALGPLGVVMALFWFVQYNPFYFFSASWVLLGMYMVTSDLSDWYAGQLVVAVVMHLYELCLLGGAWLLFRMAGKRRPATILGLAALFFLFDPTLRSEGVTALGPLGVVMALFWVVLVVTKLAVLGYTFRLKWSVEVWIVPVVIACVIAAMPHLLASRLFEPRPLLIAAAWLGAIVLAACVALRPRVRCGDQADHGGRYGGIELIMPTKHECDGGGAEIQREIRRRQLQRAHSPGPHPEINANHHAEIKPR